MEDRSFLITGCSSVTIFPNMGSDPSKANLLIYCLDKPQRLANWDRVIKSASIDLSTYIIRKSLAVFRRHVPATGHPRKYLLL